MAMQARLSAREVIVEEQRIGRLGVLEALLANLDDRLMLARLAQDALYFKSGSLYECRPEPGFTCRQYQGNKANYMNSVAIVERPDGAVYLVALMSNVFKVNSAVEHQSLATYVDGVIPAPAATAPPPPPADPR